MYKKKHRWMFGKWNQKSVKENVSDYFLAVPSRLDGGDFASIVSDL